jgi:hypothetical protein
MINPYNDHDNALLNVVKLVKNGNDAVDLSFIIVLNVDNGDPIKKIAEKTPTEPITL